MHYRSRFLCLLFCPEKNGSVYRLRHQWPCGYLYLNQTNMYSGECTFTSIGWMVVKIQCIHFKDKGPGANTSYTFRTTVQWQIIHANSVQRFCRKYFTSFLHIAALRSSGKYLIYIYIFITSYYNKRYILLVLLVFYKVWVAVSSYAVPFALIHRPQV